MDVHSTIRKRQGGLVFWILCLAWMGSACGANQEAFPDRQAQDLAAPESEIPAGVVEGPFKLTSLIYPGTQREYWLYVPAQYDAEKPACSLILQDGIRLARQWKLPETIDRLIHSGEMPVTLGIFVEPGMVVSQKQGAQARFNRSAEYDSLGDTYARFLIEELLPDVASRYQLSSDPNHRALAGASSGGICAFNAAWERPDAFRRVLSAMGSFVGLRGAHELPLLVRKTEPKPIRVFLQDGAKDLNIYAGDWWISNQAMLSSLQWAGYDVQHQWMEGVGHSSEDAAAVVPQALRWLWRDFPEPISAGLREEGARRVDVVIPGNPWQQISSGHESVDATTCNAGGVLFFSDSRAGRIYRMGDDNKTRIFKESPTRISAMRFGPDEKLYVVRDSKQIIRMDMNGTEEVVINDQRCHRLITLPEGFYFTDDVKNKVYWSSYGGQFREAVSLAERPLAMVTTPDQAFLNLALQNQQSLVSLLVSEDFTLKHRQRFGHLHMPYLESSNGVTAMAVDDQGRCYVASSMGIQVLDQLGRVHLILSAPSRSPITGLVIGGPLRDTLFASDGKSVYSRKLKIKGIDSFGPPVTPPKPAL
jgi:gluconolactonase